MIDYFYSLDLLLIGAVYEAIVTDRLPSGETMCAVLIALPDEENQ